MKVSATTSPDEPMKTFEFSTNVVREVVKQLEAATEYIRIAIFQIHNSEVFKTLNRKLEEGVRVEIFTLPFDSINRDVRDEVEGALKGLVKNGAKIYLCKWNVGDPERTTTAMGHWYSFHGKFIVTDKSAIALSANFTRGEELDAALSFKRDNGKINEFNSKFDELVELFVSNRAGYDGTIRQKITDAEASLGRPNATALFEQPRVIETQTHKEHWIRHYPALLCPTNVNVEDRLYLTPFDCRGREILTSLLFSASRFAFLSTESFTDPDFALTLSRAKVTRKIDIRILANPDSMDYSDRNQKMFKDLLAHQILIRTTLGPLHGKILITDKYLAVGSINLNRINLGFSQTNIYWRENTETVLICSDKDIIADAKRQFSAKFENESLEVEQALARKLEGYVTDLFKKHYDLNSRREVKVLFAKWMVKEEVQRNSLFLEVGSLTARIVSLLHNRRRTVGKQDFLMALTMYYLSERKHDFTQLQEKLRSLDPDANLKDIITTLVKSNLIEKEGDFYKINIKQLIEAGI
jgi:phosphatidylserine/phosphatidylglycerophosphate/cardiolipin synthase-like enzyme